MTEVIGIRFKQAGKVYFFDPDGLSFAVGDGAVVETARGVEYGVVLKPNSQVEDHEVVQPLKKVLRAATEEDTATAEENRKKEEEALLVCEEKVAALDLPMKLVDVEITFDRNKLIFYFTSDGRVDFRELVKELAAVFRTRIELRQIGVRDEAKMLNGIGICGRPLCCATFLGDFQPVSIKMAKEQKLSLNPTKISGICGRLMCCLKYEEDVYEELNRSIPEVGDVIKTTDGTGEILSVNTLKQIVKAGVRKDERDAPTIGFYHTSEFKLLRRKKQRKGKDPLEAQMALAAEELAAEQEQRKAEAVENAAELARKQAEAERRKEAAERRRQKQEENEQRRLEQRKAEKQRKEEGEAAQRPQRDPKADRPVREDSRPKKEENRPKKENDRPKKENDRPKKENDRPKKENDRPKKESRPPREDVRLSSSEIRDRGFKVNREKPAEKPVEKITDKPQSEGSEQKAKKKYNPYRKRKPKPEGKTE